MPVDLSHCRLAPLRLSGRVRDNVLIVPCPSLSPDLGSDLRALADAGVHAGKHFDHVAATECSDEALALLERAGFIIDDRSYLRRAWSVAGQITLPLFT